MACDVAASSESDVCERFKACIEQEGDSAAGSQALSVFRCDKLRSLDLPSADIGLMRMSVLSVEADHGAPASEAPDSLTPHPDAGQASFLVVERAGATCLVEKVLPWDWDRMGTFDDVFSARWQPQGPSWRLSLRAHHVSRLELDEEERANGESDVRYEHCNEIDYEVEAGWFHVIGERRSEAPCPSE